MHPTGPASGIDESTKPAKSCSMGFWVLGALLVAYVALCTPQRDRLASADAWEHHRAIKALVEQIWKPGNPTYDSPIPSIRYSPYTVGLAMLCRVTHLSAYAGLSVGAVMNTALLVLGVWTLLKAFGETGAAAAVSIVMVALWGGSPGYANSYALADLPWHEVNPSAFSFALTLIVWGLFKRHLDQPSAWRLIVATILMSVAMIDHPMTGVFGVLGIGLLALLAAPVPAGSRWNVKAIATAIGIGVVVLVIACLWPWYSFIAAIRWKGDREYWFNIAILKLMLFQWCVPGLVGLVLCLSLRTRPIVRLCLIGAMAIYGIAVLSMVGHSPSLARLPLPGMIFVHIPLGIYAHRAKLFCLRSWGPRLRALASATPAAAVASSETLLAIGLAYFLIPQLIAIPTGSHLARSYIARVLHKPDKAPHLKPPMDALLISTVATHDVVLSDEETSWIIPSSSGRVIVASHYELLVPGQAKRAEDIEQFFKAGTSETTRREIINRYGAKWIVINRTNLTPDLAKALIRESAVVKREGDLVLMDAARWLASAP